VNYRNFGVILDADFFSFNNSSVAVCKVALRPHPFHPPLTTFTVNKLIETSQGTGWNQKVQTDRTIPNNKPDIIIRDNEKGTCMLLDVAISGDRNVIKKRSREDSKI